MAVLEAAIDRERQRRQTQGRFAHAYGTVRGDLHDIGKNLVGMMAEGAGFELHDIGVDQE